MKKAILSIIAGSFISLSSFAQIPNSGFENWASMGSYSVPLGWGTMNNATASYSIYTATMGTPGSPGNAYLRLTSKTTGSTVVNGIAVSGKLDTMTMQPISGFAFNQRPSSLAGKWQHMIYGSSAGLISVTLTRWDNMMNMRMPVGSGSVALTGMAMSWSNFSIPVNYVDGNNPDTCIIVMKASGNTPTNNDYLYVDNLAFSGTVTAVKNNEANKVNMEVFPNPANDKLTVSYNGAGITKIKMNVLDATGKNVNSRSIISHNNEYTIDVADLAKGFYFIQLVTDNEVISRKFLKQ